MCMNAAAAHHQSYGITNKVQTQMTCVHLVTTLQGYLELNQLIYWLIIWTHNISIIIRVVIIINSPELKFIQLMLVLLDKKTILVLI